MKIGTITFHYAYNYGSALQAYALKRKLELLGHDVSVINYIYEMDKKRYNLFRFNQYSKPYKILVDLISLPNTINRKNNYLKFQKQFLKISDCEILTDDELTKISENFNCVICGSDQIWNAECTKKVVPAYFLNFVKNPNILKMSYAPSIAHDSIPDEYIFDFKLFLSNLDAISVREETGKKILENLTDKKITKVLDPTLLLELEEYINLEKKVNIDGKYLVLYTLERNKTIFEYAKKIAEQNNIKVVYFNRFNINEFKNGINMFKYGPCEFLNLIHNAEYVITNSFHATIFSILYGKKFTTFLTSKSGSRMNDFLTNLGLQDRIYSDNHDISQDIDYKQANLHLNEERKKSLEYLELSLNMKEV